MNLRPLPAITLLVTTLLSAQATFAAETPRADQREANQAARIAQGAASGSLTGREQRRLNREQKAINKAEQNAKADGVVTPQARRKLHRAQNAASRDIYRQKHDAQVKP